jgi:putative nucleotidyltransferase with HDIG domain
MTHILFVDDEPNVLDDLRQMLRAYRRDWTMQFCVGPKQALAALAKEPFDVVVTDMCMPEMDGAELLTRIKELYPTTLRIVLCGQSEQERILCAIGPAHQYLSKPCDPGFLRESVTRASSIEKRLNNPEMQSIASRMDSLPSLPNIYFELVEELRAPEASVARVGALISQDIGMTTKVLQLVNSSFFGLPVHVDSAKHAAALLGLNTLKPLVLTASIFRQLEESHVSPQFLEKVVAHSLAVAGVAKQLALAEELGHKSADQAFLAGALHDIGKIILADNLGRNYTILQHKAQVENAELTALEIAQLGASHANLGAFLLGLWGLPQEIISAVAFHHDPQSSGDEAFSALTAVHVANALVNQVERIDSAYLAQVGREDQLQAWRQIADLTATPA